MKSSDPRHRKIFPAGAVALLLPLALVVALVGWRAALVERQVIVVKSHPTAAMEVAAMPAVRDSSVPSASEVRFVDRQSGDEEVTTF